MALPKLDYPTFEIPGVEVKGSPVKFRPFLVKEQKMLMMAVQSKQISDVVDSIKQIIRNCCIDDIDVDTLSLSQLELIFIHLRAKSVSEVINLVYRCNNTLEDESRCNMIINVDVDLLKDVESKSNQKSNLIWLNDTIAIKMRNPNLEITNLINEDNLEFADLVIAKCIEQIIEGDEVHDADTVNEKELIEFVSQIRSNDYDKMWEFVKNAPTIKYEKVHKCPRCDHEHTIKLEGLSDFFS
ncbi:MAG: hypothetical protein ACO3YM_07350 [Candidatus Kapaibacteriota bacterium]